MAEDFVAAGSPPGWYKHPTQEVDYFWTGKGFGSVSGQHVRRRHKPGGPDFIPAEEDPVATWVRDYGVDSALDTIPRSQIVSLPEVPGYRIVKVWGVVTELSSASGWTATVKGNTALDKSLEGLAKAAADLGANAIVGFASAAFGAHGGITSGFGGDAVGILLSGTAVTISPVAPQ